MSTEERCDFGDLLKDQCRSDGEGGWLCEGCGDQ